MKSIPLLGNLLEEAVFGTLEEVRAPEEARKLWEALQDIGSRVNEQSVSIEEVLNYLREDHRIGDDTRALIDELKLQLSGHQLTENKKV